MASSTNILIKIMGDITDFASKIDKATSKTKLMTSDLDAYSSATGKNLESVGKGWQDLGKKITSAGVSVTKFASIPAATLLAPSIKAAITYEDAFAGVRKTVDATEAEFTKLNKAIRDMSKEIPASTEELAKVMEVAGQLGIAAQDLEKFTEVAVALGVSTNLSSEQAATGLARLSTIMGLTSADFEKMGSTIVELGNNYATTESEILNMTLRLSGAAKVAGYTTPEIMGIATALTSVGITAEAGGTSMSKLMSSIQVAGSVGVTQMRDLENATGMTYEELHLMATNLPKDFRALADSLGKPQDELKKIVKAGWDLSKMAKIAGVDMEEFAEIVSTKPTEALNAFIVGLFDTERHGADAIALLNEMGISQERLRDVILRTGSAEEFLNEAIRDGNLAWEENVALQNEAEQKYNTTASQLKMAWNAIKDIGIALGNALLPSVREFADWLKNLSITITDMDPKKLETIAKTLGAIALVGPGLTIAGKALGTFGTALRGISTIEKVLKEGLGITRFMDSINLPKGFKEGGWLDSMLVSNDDITITRNLRLRSKALNKFIGTDVTKYRDEMRKLLGDDAWDVPIKSTNKYSAALSKLSTSFQANIRDSNGVVSASSAVSNGFNSLKTGAAALAQSPFMSGVILIGLITYLKKTYDSSAAFREGLSALWGVVKTGIDLIMGLVKWFVDLFNAITGMNTGMGDLILVVGGVVGALTVLNPVIGGITAAVGLFSAAMKWLGKDTAEAKYEQEKFDAVTGQLFDSLGEGSAIFTAYSNEHLPKLRDSLNELYTVAEGGSIQIVKEEDLEKDRINLETAKTNLIEYLTGYYEQTKSLRDVYTTAESEEFAAHNEFMNGLSKARLDYDISEATAAFGRISEINQLEIEGERGLSEELIIEREGLYAKLEALATRQETKDQVARDLEYASMMAHYKATGELTEKQAARLLEIQQEQLDSEKKKYMDASTESLVDLKHQLDARMITQEEYNRALENEARQLYTRTEADYEKHAAKLISEFSKMSKEEYEIGKESLLLHQSMLAYRKDASSEAAQDYKNHIEGMNNYEKSQADYRIQNSKREFEDKLKEVLKYMDEMGVLPSEMALIVKDMDGKFDLSFVTKSVKSEMTTATESAKKLGGSLGDGLAEGIASKAWLVAKKARFLVQEADGAIRNEGRIHSPSRLMADLGEYFPEGLALGIENGEGHVADAMGSLVSLMDVADMDKTISLGLDKQVNESYSSNFVSTLIQDVAKTVVREISKHPLRSYISEEEFEENVLDTVSRELVRT